VNQKGEAIGDLVTGLLESAAMTISDYLRNMSDDELVKQFDEFSTEDDAGWTSFSVSVTPYGSLTKTLVEREINRRVAE